MRSWGAEAITSLVKAVLNYKFDPPLHQNEVGVVFVNTVVNICSDDVSN